MNGAVRLRLHYRRQARLMKLEAAEMIAAGWEYVGEGGGSLWELYRGCRTDCIITESRIAYGGRALWVRVVKQEDFLR